MKIKLFFILFLLPVLVFSQKKNSSDIKIWTFAGLMPLQKGTMFYGKTSIILHDFTGFNLHFGSGFANPNANYYNVTNYNAQSSFISGGMFFKTPDKKRNKQRKLGFIMTSSIVLGQGKESANYYFKGNDFNNYTSKERYSQKYDFSYLQLTLGFTYFIKEKWKLEIGSYIGLGDAKNRVGKQYFSVEPNYVYAYHGIGGNIGVGYLLWKPKSK